MGEHLFVDWKPPDRYSYSYLLGLYLGDGYVGLRSGGGAHLLIACDACYTELIDDCRTAVKLVIPESNV